MAQENTGGGYVPDLGNLNFDNPEASNLWSGSSGGERTFNTPTAPTEPVAPTAPGGVSNEERTFQERVIRTVAAVTGVTDPSALGEMGKGVMFRIMDIGTTAGYVPNLKELVGMSDATLKAIANEAGANNYFNPGYIREREREFMSRAAGREQTRQGGMGQPQPQGVPSAPGGGYVPPSSMYSQGYWRPNSAGAQVASTGVGGGNAYVPNFSGRVGANVGNAGYVMPDIAREITGAGYGYPVKPQTKWWQ